MRKTTKNHRLTRALMVAVCVAAIGLLATVSFASIEIVASTENDIGVSGVVHDADGRPLVGASVYSEASKLSPMMRAAGHSTSAPASTYSRCRSRAFSRFIGNCL